jgi:predicted glycoside hydrolase/deacetylase ChbG (UPF0249 family)
LLSNIIDDF